MNLNYSNFSLVIKEKPDLFQSNLKLLHHFSDISVEMESLRDCSRVNVVFRLLVTAKLQKNTK